ncbi:MAG: DUF2177 family protein [archaeon]
MDLLTQIRPFIVCLIIIAALDYFFIKKIAGKIYLRELNEFSRKKDIAFSPRSGPAFVIYLVLAGGALSLAYMNLGSTYLQSLGSGALFGFLIYGFYDMTNYAILAKWSFKLSMIDIVWGTLLNAFMAVFLHWVM